MDYHDFLLGVQLIAEENVGKQVRDHERSEQGKMLRNRENMKR